MPPTLDDLATTNGATTRKAFLLAGAAGAAGTLATVGGLARTSGAAAATPAVSTALFITSGDMRLVDGARVRARSFSALPATVSVPGPPILATTGATVTITVTNNEPRAHAFAIEGVVPPTQVPPGATRTIHFTAPAAGTYVYEDPTDGPVNRLLGLHGVLIVSPPGAPDRPYPGGPAFRQQYTWVISEIDPDWNVRAAAGRAIDSRRFVPRYFTINGRSGIDAVHDPATAIRGRLGDTTLIRIAHVGLAAHALHWHGNHVTVLTRNGGVLPMQLDKDVVALFAGDRVEVILPHEPPRDAADPVRSSVYAIHDHLALGTTAGGGLYPQGMLTHWSLEP